MRYKYRHVYEKVKYAYQRIFNSYVKFLAKFEVWPSQNIVSSRLQTSAQSVTVRLYSHIIVRKVIKKGKGNRKDKSKGNRKGRG